MGVFSPRARGNVNQAAEEAAAFPAQESPSLNWWFKTGARSKIITEGACLEGIILTVL